MKITNDRTKRFENMVFDFANKHGLRTTIEHDGLKTMSKVYFDEPRSCIQATPYYVKWDEVRSLTEAATTIFSDVMCKFNLNGVANSFKIKDVIFNDPATIVLWEDGTKTVVKCSENDIYSEETGLAMAIAKKALGNRGNFNNVFKKWVPEYTKSDCAITVAVDYSDKTLAKAFAEILEDRLNKFRRGLL